MHAVDELGSRLSALRDEDLQRGLEVFHSRLKEAEVSYLNSCVRCGLCADACHYHRAEPILENMPAHKLDLIASVFRRYSTATGRVAPGLVGAKSLDQVMVGAWLDAVYGRCSLCGRCSVNCTMGIALPTLFRAARAALGAMGLTPPELQNAVETTLQHGNNMAVAKEDWVETVQWIEEELRMETGDPGAKLPLDKKGAKVLFTVNPREPKFFPLSLQASAKVFWAAKEDWTMSSDGGWDLTNYGLFTCDDERAGAITKQLLDTMERLECKVLVVGECGHGYGAIRWESPEWLQKRHAFEVKSVLELMHEYIRDGRIQLDPKVHKEPVTLHDPCNLVRHGGLCETQRKVLRKTVSTFVEMTPSREENFCCGGGGGQLALSGNKESRLRSGGMKVDQIKATGAKVVVAPCHNCIDQLSELSKLHKLNLRVKTVAEMVADAIVPTV